MSASKRYSRLLLAGIPFLIYWIPDKQYTGMTVNKLSSDMHYLVFSFFNFLACILFIIY